MRKEITDIKRNVPVYDEVDVLVCGGGPAGFCAAVAAARRGAKTLLIEQTNALGGIATSGGHNHLCLYTAWADSQRVVGGLSFEMAKRVVTRGWGSYGTGNCDFELEGLKFVLEQMALSAGVKLLYHTQFADTIMDGNTVRGAYIQNKSGRQAVLAKRVVDATGDADVAASAGVPFEKGRPQDGAVQPCTLMFTIGGVDWKRAGAFRAGDYQLRDVWKEAQRNGDMEPFQSRVMGWWWTPTRPDQVGMNFTHVVGCDPTNAASITDSTVEARRQAMHMIPVFQKYVPGMENCYLIATAALLGTRESRRILGRYVLTDDDMLQQKSWEDSIGYGSFFIDVHNCTGPGMDAETYRPEPGFRYQIPYRCLVPQRVNNLLVAGRCVSVTHRALGSLRVMPQCGLMGEAAGTACAMSIEADCMTSQVDVAQLQQRLRKADGIIFEEDIVPDEALKPGERQYSWTV